MAKYPVVVYGASGYTGMLIMDWLIDQNIALSLTQAFRGAKVVCNTVCPFAKWLGRDRSRSGNGSCALAAVHFI